MKNLKHVKLFSEAIKWYGSGNFTEDPSEQEEEPDDIIVYDPYDLYFENRLHYNIFDKNPKDYFIGPLVRREGYACPGTKYNGTLYLGIRKAGQFFNYDRKYIWVFLSNSFEKGNHARHMRGFYITITTVDDAALYADWSEPITSRQLERVVNYFNEHLALRSAENTLRDIENIIGPCDGVSYS